MGAVWDVASQVFTRDFWGRILTDPLAAVRQHPELAAKSAAVGAAATLAVAGGIAAAPAVVSGIGSIASGIGSFFGGLFGAARVAATPLSFAARRPVLSFVLATQSDLPTEVVRTFGQIFGQPTIVSPSAPAPAPQVPTPTVRQRSVPTVTRGPVAGPGQQFEAMFGW